MDHILMISGLLLPVLKARHVLRPAIGIFKMLS